MSLVVKGIYELLERAGTSERFKRLMMLWAVDASAFVPSFVFSINVGAFLLIRASFDLIHSTVDLLNNWFFILF